MPDLIDEDGVKRFPAQQKLKQKAGTGSIASDAIKKAESFVAQKKKVFSKIKPQRINSLADKVSDLESFVNSEDFTAAPDKEALLSSVVNEIMNIKAQTGFAGNILISELTALILLSLDNKPGFDKEECQQLLAYVGFLKKYNGKDVPAQDPALITLSKFWRARLKER